MGWKPSVFNEAIETEGTIRVFNSRSQALLSAGLSRKLLRGGLAALSPVERGIVRSKGMAVPGDLDERSKLRTEFTRRKHNSSFVSLIVVPSYRCNCACPDCFQQSFDRKTVMDEPTRAAVSDLLAHAIRMRRPASVILWLSGGEPFVSARECLDLSVQAARRCEELGVSLFQAATTNGTLVDTEPGLALAKRLDIVYLSLSESESAQLAQRPFRGGRNSYQAVLRAFPILADLGKQIIVRFNVASGSAGCEQVREVIADIHRALGEVAYPRLSFEFSALLCFREKCFSDPLTSSEGRELLAAMAGALETLAESTPWPRTSFRLPAHGALPAMYEDEHFEICDFLRGDGFFVTPGGEMYTCTTKLGDPRHRLGRVRDRHELFFDPRFLRVVNYDPFEDPQCRDCSLLPLCLTRCPLWSGDDLRFSDGSCFASRKAMVDEHLRRHRPDAGGGPCPVHCRPEDPR